jgi:hypothetical protein
MPGLCCFPAVNATQHFVKKFIQSKQRKPLLLLPMLLSIASAIMQVVTTWLHLYAAASGTYPLLLLLLLMRLRLRLRLLLLPLLLLLLLLLAAGLAGGHR